MAMSTSGHRLPHFKSTTITKLSVCGYNPRSMYCFLPYKLQTRTHSLSLALSFILANPFLRPSVINEALASPSSNPTYTSKHCSSYSKNYSGVFDIPRFRDSRYLSPTLHSAPSTMPLLESTPFCPSEHTSRATENVNTLTQESR